MIKKALILSFFLTPIVNSQVITQDFGNGVNAFTIEFVQIGNPNNITDANGFGSVAYAYNIGKYEISAEIIAKANSVGGLGITSETLGSRPATAITWNEAARFVNWLNTSKGYQAAYNFTTSGANDNITIWGPAQYSGTNQYRHKDSFYFLPSADEWYKAAFFDSQKNGGAGYWKYATGSDSAPAPVNQGTDPGTAVYSQPDPYGNPSDGLVDAYKAGGLSPFGTMGQGGNALEWVESASDRNNDVGSEFRDLHGGSFASDSTGILAGARAPNPPDYAHFGFGFRIASIPEPSGFSLLAIGLGALAILRRRRA
jgi:formylglycine-generating enzyme required for sulfatase activity